MPQFGPSASVVYITGLACGRAMCTLCLTIQNVSCKMRFTPGFWSPSFITASTRLDVVSVSAGTRLKGKHQSSVSCVEVSWCVTCVRLSKQTRVIRYNVV